MEKSNIEELLNWEELSAYAETHSSRSLVAYPSSIEDCLKIMDYSKKRGLSICNRAGGYTYGDMILNNNQVVLNLSKMNKVLSWDKRSGEIIVEPGVEFADVFKLGLIENWTLNSCPGGMNVSIGGAVSNNVHGKDSWGNGNFGNQVLQIKILLSDGSIKVADRFTNERLFRAIIGGMGLLGIIVEIKLQLSKIPSPFVKEKSISVSNINESLDYLDNFKDNNDFSVAWVDAFKTGNNLGRGFVTTAKWIETEKKISKSYLNNSLKIPSKIFGVIPAKPFWYISRPLFRPLSIKNVNRLNYYLSKLKNKYFKEKFSLFTDYNFMHNKIPDLKHVYRPFGFLEFQPLIPKSSGRDAIQELFKICQYYKSESLLCGVKLHREDDFLLSYSGEGYSVGIDLQIGGRNKEDIKNFSKVIFEYTLSCKGKIFLAKDELLSGDYFKKMYPNYETFFKIKKELDPNQLFQSDMFRRLIG